MELVTRQSQTNMWRLRKDEKLTTLRIFICVLLVKVDVCRKRTLVTFIAAFFISIIQNTLLWGCFLPIFAFRVLIFKRQIAFIPPVGRQLLCFVWTWLSNFARKLIPEWRKDEYLAKNAGTFPSGGGRDPWGGRALQNHSPNECYFQFSHMTHSLIQVK